MEIARIIEDMDEDEKISSVIESIQNKSPRGISFTEATNIYEYVFKHTDLDPDKLNEEEIKNVLEELDLRKDQNEQTI